MVRGQQWPCGFPAHRIWTCDRSILRFGLLRCADCCCSRPKPALGSSVPPASSRHRGPDGFPVSPPHLFSGAEAQGKDAMRRCLLKPYSWILPCLLRRHLHPLVPAANLAVSRPAALANHRPPVRWLLRLSPRPPCFERSPDPGSRGAHKCVPQNPSDPARSRCRDLMRRRPARATETVTRADSSCSV